MSMDNNINKKETAKSILCKFLFGDKLSSEEIAIIASLSDQQEIDLIIELTTENIRSCKTLDATRQVAARMFEILGYNYLSLDKQQKNKNFMENIQEIAKQRQSLKQDEKGPTR